MKSTRVVYGIATRRSTDSPVTIRGIPSISFSSSTAEAQDAENNLEHALSEAKFLLSRYLDYNPGLKNEKLAITIMFRWSSSAYCYVRQFVVGRSNCTLSVGNSTNYLYIDYRCVSESLYLNPPEVYSGLQTPFCYTRIDDVTLDPSSMISKVKTDLSSMLNVSNESGIVLIYDPFSENSKSAVSQVTVYTMNNLATYPTPRSLSLVNYNIGPENLEEIVNAIKNAANDQARADVLLRNPYKALVYAEEIYNKLNGLL